MMWIEKYRPDKFESVVGLDPTIPELITDEMPHFLFVGTPGTGKTTVAKIIVNERGTECLCLNASDERGIDVIREKVKSFAQTKGMQGGFKIVFLDEADYLTKDAQMTLRNLMETYHTNCRFILTANYLNKIDPALQSRCKVFTFRPQNEDEIIAWLTKICEIEMDKGIMPDALQALVKRYKPDIRTMLNELEMLSKKDGVIIELHHITAKKEEVADLFNLIKSKKFTDSKQWILNSNLDIHHIIHELHDYVLSATLEVSKKMAFITALAELEFKLGMSVDKEVQISGGLVHLIQAL